MTTTEPLDRTEAERRYAAFDRLAARRRSRRRGTSVAGGLVGVSGVAAALIWAGLALSGLGRGERTAPASPTGGSVVSVGASNACAITSTGGVKCWGEGTGDGTGFRRTSPVDVAGLDEGVVSVSSGWSFACAVLEDGKAWCWGSNSGGQLGNGSTGLGAEPVAVSGLSEVAGVATGGAHACAVTRGGAVSCWGANGAGQLGDGTEIQRSVPEPVLGLREGVLDVVAGYRHSCALMDTGRVRCWGANEYGQVGDETLIDRTRARSVKGLGSVVAISGNGADHTCALTERGEVLCWGSNRYGTIGDGTHVDRRVPTQVGGLPIGVVALSAGERDTCVLTSTGTMSCWGSGDRGQLGRDPIKARNPGSTVPIPMTGLPPGIQAISVGGGSVCALTGTGDLVCWGNNASGELGTGLKLGDFSKKPRQVLGDWLTPG